MYNMAISDISIGRMLINHAGHIIAVQVFTFKFELRAEKHCC